jgi:hypothetical protein
MAQGDAFTRGTFTSTEGAASRPASFISSTPRGYGPDVVFISWRRWWVARLHTNSRVSSMKATESLRPSEANITMGGSLETPLKYEYGARLISPLWLIEVIQPIGRGATIALNGSCGRPWFRLLGS